MQIFFHKRFDKKFAKLSTRQQNAVDQTIEIFQKDPCHPTLKNHKLKGKFKDRRAISAGGDIRLIFEEYENYTLVLFLSVGSHNQVY